MRLFHCQNAKPEVIATANVIQTPLGDVRLKVSVQNVDGSVLDETLPSQTFALPNGGRIIAWQHSDFAIELLVCRPVFVPQEGFAVTDLWGALWRVKAIRAIGPFVFSAVWDAEYSWKDFDTNSGQYLYANLWEDANTQVSIGTQDDDMLALRAFQESESPPRNVRRVRESGYLPPEWKSYFIWPSFTQDSPWGQNYGAVDREHFGISNPLPSLRAEQAFQLPFLVAWADVNGEKGELSACATSLAVETTPAQILAGEKCT